MKFKFIADVGIVWHRLWSMRLILITTGYTAAAGGWAVIPADARPNIPEGLRIVIALGGVLLPALAAMSLVLQQPQLPMQVAEVKRKQDMP